MLGDWGQALPLPLVCLGTGHQGQGDWGCLSLLLVGCSSLLKICLSLLAPQISQNLPPSKNQDGEHFYKAGFISSVSISLP